MTGCTPASADEPGPATTTLVNPVAFCVERGGTYAIRRAPNGSESGVCALPYGAGVEAWAHSREQADAGSASVRPRT